MSAPYHPEGLGAVESRSAWQQGNGLFTRIDDVPVNGQKMAP